MRTGSAPDRRRMGSDKQATLRPWTVILLALAGGMVALGIAVNDGSTGLAAVSAVLVVLGGSGAAVVIAFWAARAMGLGRADSSGGRRETARVRRAVDELVSCVKEAESKGVLMLPQRSIGECAELFRLGAEMVVAGEPVEVIRARLGDLGDRAGEAEARMRERIVLVCRWLPMGALGLALAMVVWLLASLGSPLRLGTLAPMGLLLAVYGAFAVAAIAVEVGDRLVSEGSEREMIAGMVIETLAAIRAGERSERVEARLRGFLTPGMGAAVADGDGLRKAA
jgi:flagellar motor component MotA